jgi:HEAT repeat protein
VCARAASALGQYKDHASDSVPALIRALKDREKVDEFGTVCIDVLLALGSLGPTAKSAIPPLLDLLSDQDPVVRRLAALALGNIGPKEEGVQKALVRAVKEETNNNARAGAAWALAQAGTEAKSTVPALLEGLKNSKALSGPELIQAQKAIVFALGRIGPDAKEAVPALLAILRKPDSDDSLRLSVVDTLGLIGPAAREAAPTLKDMTRDPSSQVRVAAKQALEKLEPQ